MIPGELAAARPILHHAVLLVSAVGKDLLPPRADASHKTVAYDDEVRGFVAPYDEELPIRACLCLRDLSLRVLSAASEDRLPLPGRTLDEAEAWLNDRFRERWPGVPAPVVRETYEDLAPHGVGTGDAVPAVDPAILTEWERYYALSRVLLDEVRESVAQAGPIRIWPHHFDEAVLAPVGEGEGEEARSVGIGFSPGDTSRPEPYWYVSPWPYPSEERLPRNPVVGTWHAEPFFGATLTASEVFARGLPAADTARAFFQATIPAARGLLGA